MIKFMIKFVLFFLFNTRLAFSIQANKNYDLTTIKQLHKEKMPGRKLSDIDGIKDQNVKPENLNSGIIESKPSTKISITPFQI